MFITDDIAGHKAQPLSFRFCKIDSSHGRGQGGLGKMQVGKSLDCLKHKNGALGDVHFVINA